jgi:hypothetical protein
MYVYLVKKLAFLWPDNDFYEEPLVGKIKEGFSIANHRGVASLIEVDEETYILIVTISGSQLYWIVYL